MSEFDFASCRRLERSEPNSVPPTRSRPLAAKRASFGEGGTPVTDNKPSNSDPENLATDWRELEVELGWFGTKLDEIRARPEQVGRDVIADLEQRFEDLSRQVIELKDKTVNRMDELQTAAKSAEDGRLTLQGGLDAAKEKAGDIGQKVAGAAEVAGEALKARAGEVEESTRHYRESAAESASETGERLKLAAQDVGHGFGIAWQALKRDFEIAYSRLVETSEGDKPDDKR